MNGFSKRFTRMLLLLLSLSLAAAAGAETAGRGEEQGLEEIMPLIALSDVGETEGMSLEEMTDAFSGAAMSEYIDHATGFSMQYPSVFQFDEGGNSPYATTADGKATLSIENMPQQGTLDEDTLKEAIKLEIPDAVPEKNEQNGCLRVDRMTDGGSAVQTDLYLLTERSLHHIVLRYPSAEQTIYHSYIEYMINTMGTNDTDLG